MSLIGLKLVKVRAMTQAEQDAEGWDDQALVIEFNDGTKIYPSQDEEGNGPGRLFGKDKDGDFFSLVATENS